MKKSIVIGHFIKKVLVTYPDNTHRETTIKELHDFFKEETDEWKSHFFSELERMGIANTNYARYTLLIKS